MSITGTNHKPYRLRALSNAQQMYFKSYIVDSDAVKAYKAGGYIKEGQVLTQRQLQNKAWHVLNSTSMQAALAVHVAKREAERAKEDAITIDAVRAKLVELELLARKQNNLAVAVKCVELQGKTCNAFTDNLNVTSDQRREYTEAQQIEAKRLAGILLREKYQLPVIDAEATEVSTGENNS